MSRSQTRQHDLDNKDFKFELSSTTNKKFIERDNKNDQFLRYLEMYATKYVLTIYLYLISMKYQDKSKIQKNK